MKRIAVLLIALGLGLSRRAAAGEAAPSPLEASPRRPLPSYDGREPLPTPLNETLLGVPRFLLAPPYLVSEYVLRRPLSVAIPAAENVDLFTRVYNFFAFGHDHKAGIVPVGLLEFDFKPSVGFYAFWDDAGFDGNDLSLHTEAWPDDWFAANLRERVAIDDNRTFQIELSEMHRPDRVFYGLGPSSLEGSESRYGLQELSAALAYEWRFWRSSRVETAIAARDVRVFDGHYGDDPSLTAEASTGAFPIPYGFGRGYAAETNRIVAAVDTRASESRRGSGFRVEVDAEQGSAVQGLPVSGWVRYASTAAGYVDLNGLRRVLSLSFTTQLVDPLGSKPLPFTELVSLGGDHAMRGFFTGRLLGRSAAVLTASYAWPIGPWIDGDLQAAVGNVFSEHLTGFDFGLLRFSGAIGVSIGGLQKTAVMGAQDAPLEILLGAGSETFDHGGQIDSVRVTAGVPLSF